MKPYAYQNQIADLVRQSKNIILQAPTGAGKTFASLWPFYKGWAASRSQMPQKCVYAVPMRVLANQFEEEVNRLVTEDMRFKTPPTVKKQTGEFKEDPEFRADMTFATIDQVLSSWLMAPYSLPQRLGNLNAGAFVGSYLIFDEFHLFEPDSTLPTTLQMLKTLNGVSPFILMTATFSKDMLEKLAGYLDAESFLLTEDMLQEIPAQEKDRRFYTTDTPLTYKDEAKRIFANATAVAHILQAHKNQTNAKQRTLVVCNQVERAQSVYTALRDQKPDNVTVCLLHSRFLKSDRQGIERFIRQEFNKDKRLHTVNSLILVATQVVEVGLDMSCVTLHTELAPAASLLQRAGRCARYAGEKGRVYVYPVNEKGYAPYHGKYAHQQCDLAWEWLAANQDRHLNFTDEQALINYAHTDSDNMILKGVFETEFAWLSQIHKAWRGEKNRGETARLIRNIQSVSMVVHPDPDQLTAAPFKVDSFSLHPGTLQGKFKQWQEINAALDPDFEEGHFDWLACKLVEDMDEEDVQGNRPIRYAFKQVNSEHDLFAPLIAINPALVGYSPELGLTLYAGEKYQCDVPETAVTEQFSAYSYKLESYFRHIELVHKAFAINSLTLFSTIDSLTLFSTAAQRLEQAYDWQPGIITAMAHLVIGVHDVGKLDKGWQDWAHQYQEAIGKKISYPNFAAAHTDFDPENMRQKEVNKHLRGKRPSHAVESALAATPILQALIAHDLQRYMPLLRAAFTAVARHHAPFSSQPDSYQLIDTFQQEIEATLQLLPQQIQMACQGVEAQDTTNIKQLPPNFIERYFLIKPQNEKDVCCYMLLVRALRTADQKGTSMGSQ